MSMLIENTPVPCIDWLPDFISCSARAKTAAYG